MRVLIAFVALGTIAGILVGCANSEPTPDKPSDYASPNSASAPDEQAIQDKMATGQQSAGGRSATPGK